MMQQLQSEAELDAYLAATGPRWLLKHSNACPTSFAALGQVEDYAAAHDLPVAMIVIQEQRPLSNAVAQRLRYTHQSPQLFLIEDGAVRYHASHWGITAKAMVEAAAG